MSTGWFWMISGWYLSNIWMMRSGVLIEFISPLHIWVKTSLFIKWGVVKYIDRIFGWYVGDIRMIFLWYVGDIRMRFLWYVGDIRMIFLWYVGDIWTISRWYVVDIWMISPTYHPDITNPNQYSSLQLHHIIIPPSVLI